jgi:hypothetical protein
MDHWEGRQCLDFWTCLVDSKAATENSNEVNKNNSFTRTESLPLGSKDAEGPPDNSQ